MKKKLIILFFMIVPIAHLLFYSCGCNIEQHVKYSHKVLSLKNLDNNGHRAIVSDSLQLNKNAYGIRLYLHVEEKKVLARAMQFNSIFIQSANAFNPGSCPYVYQAIDSIVSIQVITIYDFDNRHTANSEITEYFKVAQTYSSVEDYITVANYTQRRRDYGDFARSGKIEIDLMLMTAPTANNSHQFKVRIELSDGRILEEQTIEIQLL